VTNYTTGTDLLAFACVYGQGSLPPAAVNGGVWEHEGSGVSTPTSAMRIQPSVPSKRRADQLVSVVGLRARIADAQGPPPRGAPV
jgi:hypothetical protein